MRCCHRIARTFFFPTHLHASSLVFHLFIPCGFCFLQVIYIAFNILLIIVASILARKNEQLDMVIHPIFVMILVNALFQPMGFIINSQQFADRRTISLVLSPPVGLLLGTVLEAFLLILPSLAPALLRTPEEIAERSKLENEIKEFHKEIQVELKRKASRKSMSVDPKQQQQLERQSTRSGGGALGAASSGYEGSEMATSPSSRLQRLRSRLGSGGNLALSPSPQSKLGGYPSSSERPASPSHSGSSGPASPSTIAVMIAARAAAAKSSIPVLSLEGAEVDVGGGDIGESL